MCEDHSNEVDMNNYGNVFENFIILKEFGNIANNVRTEDFLEIVPKAKLRRVKWVPIFNCLKQKIQNDMVQELNLMWKYENISQKLAILEKQKEKFDELVGDDKNVWRPQLNDVKAQLKAHDAARARKQIVLLESVAKDYENRVTRLKKIITAKRGYLKALQTDMQKYQKKNEDTISLISVKLKNQRQKKIDLDLCNWSIELDE